jgi:hypothetical protein
VQAVLEHLEEQVPELRQMSVVKALLSLQVELLLQAIAQAGLEQDAAQAPGLLQMSRVKGLLSLQAEFESHLIEQATV